MIWVVTDQAHIRDDLLPLVQSKGYRALHLDCIDDVPRRAKFSQPALLIVDCGLHGSFELVTEMRNEPFTQRISLVMFATADNQYRQEALRRGADAFVLKGSLDWAQLLAEIERLVGPPPGPAHSQ